MGAATLSTFNLTKPPQFKSRFASNPHTQQATLTSKVQLYFAENWPWPSEREKAVYLRMDLEGFAFRVIPNSPEERAEVVARWLTWLFLYDDLMETFTPMKARERYSRFQTMLSKLSESTEGVMPFDEMTADELILTDLIVKLISVEDKSLQDLGRSILKELVRWASTVSSKKERESAFKSGFDEYMKCRFKDVGGWLAFSLMLWARGIPFPPPVDMGHKLKTLADVALIQATYVNDLYSYRAEVAAFNEENRRLALARQRAADEGVDSENEGQHGYTIFNGVNVFIEIHGLTTDEAYAEMIKKIGFVETQYGVLLEEMRSECSTSADTARLGIVDEFSNALIDLMGGNAEWSEVCGRYNIFD